MDINFKKFYYVLFGQIVFIGYNVKINKGSKCYIKNDTYHNNKKKRA